jgi:hypothetical protein
MVHNVEGRVTGVKFNELRTDTDFIPILAHNIQFIAKLVLSFFAKAPS